jgi:hypothetical protein
MMFFTGFVKSPDFLQQNKETALFKKPGSYCIRVHEPTKNTKCYHINKNKKNHTQKSYATLCGNQIWPNKWYKIRSNPC